jgi:hypothetical protein
MPVVAWPLRCNDIPTAPGWDVVPELSPDAQLTHELTESYLAAMAGFNFLELGEEPSSKFVSAPGSDSTTVGSLPADASYDLPSFDFSEQLEQKENRIDPSWQVKAPGQPGNQPRADSSKPAAGRTTLMIRNVPRKYTQRQLLTDLLAACDFTGWADFFYLPTDLGTCRNLGYCFLNFVCPLRAAEVKNALHKLRLSSGAKSGLSIGYADFQGLDENLRNVRRSLMHRIKNREYRPLVADATGELVPITN